MFWWLWNDPPPPRIAVTTRIVTFLLEASFASWHPESQGGHFSEIGPGSKNGQIPTGQNYWAKKKMHTFPYHTKEHTPLKTNMTEEKTTVWRCISYEKLSCSIAMLVLGAAGLHINRSKKGTGSWVYPNHSKWSEGTSNIGLLRQSPAFTSGRGCFIGILTISPTYSSIIPRPTG